MSPERKAEIEQLAKEVHQAHELVKFARQMNVRNDPKEREAQSISYALLRADAEEAQSKLDAAIISLGRET